jgi:hypothetical protein
MMANRASGSPFGLRVLSKRWETELLRLFSLTLARIGQESMTRCFPEIVPSSRFVRTNCVRISCNTGWGVSRRNRENRSMGGGVC